METTIERVKKVISDNMDVAMENIQESSTRESLGADSLDVIETLMAIEGEFGLEIPDEDAQKLLMISDIVKYVDDKTAGREPEEPSEFD